MLIISSNWSTGFIESYECTMYVSIISFLTINLCIDYYNDVYFRNKDKPYVTVKEKTYTAYEGKDLEIECHVEANPEANIYWKPRCKYFFEF